MGRARVVVYFFFFQAEDGIRDYKVTGVQTCALPICHLAVVWVGYDSDEPTGFTGSAGALPVWAHIMAGLNTSSWEAPMPEGLAEMHIDRESGVEGKSGDLGGRRIIKKKKKKRNEERG